MLEVTVLGDSVAKIHIVTKYYYLIINSKNTFK